MKKLMNYSFEKLKSVYGSNIKLALMLVLTILLFPFVGTTIYVAFNLPLYWLFWGGIFNNLLLLCLIFITGMGSGNKTNSTVIERIKDMFSKTPSLLVILLLIVVGTVSLKSLYNNNIFDFQQMAAGSMSPTIERGEHVSIDVFHYKFGLQQVKFNDLVVFTVPNAGLSEQEKEKHVKKQFLKRCVGLPGDIIEIVNKKLYRNGKLIIENYFQGEPNEILNHTNNILSKQEYQLQWEQGSFAHADPAMVRDFFGPVSVPNNMIFVLGDERDHSFDSRFFGPVCISDIKGVATGIYYPLNRARKL